MFYRYRDGKAVDAKIAEQEQHNSKRVLDSICDEITTNPSLMKSTATREWTH